MRIAASARTPVSDLPFADETSVREIVSRWPATRPVFERAGLMGCGGPNGPDEPLNFFAKVHHVPLEPLKRSLLEVIRQGSARPRRELAIAPAAALALEPVHRYVPFLLASVALTLTFGATLGMINLARLTTPWFGGMPLGSVRAHAFVQVFGFVGLFVIGIACHVLPRFAGRPLAAASLTKPILATQFAGVLTVAAAFMWHDEPIGWLWAIGSFALVVASAMFLAVVSRTVAGLRGPERFGRWVIAGAAWQAIAACGSLAAAWRGDAAILQALWSAALWGSAASWIFGIGRRIFPGFLKWQPRAAGAETPAFVIYQVGAALSAAAAWPMNAAAPSTLVVAGALGVSIGAGMFSWCLGVRGLRPPRHDAEGGYQRYIPAAWVWLFVAVMLGPCWTLAAAATGSVVPLLVTDFARHALAFGFVTQVMMGVATRILPVFTGNALWSPRARTAAFYLLNVSLVLRALEVVVSAGFVPAAWPLIAAAGPPAVAAVVLFACNVVFTISGRPATAAAATAPLAIADRRVADLLGIPGALDLLVAAGFTPLRSPAMRATLAGAVTLRAACGMRNVPVGPLAARLEELERSARQRRAD
jgi:uncharacterized protein involved in response to NO